MSQGRARARPCAPPRRQPPFPRPRWKPPASRSEPAPRTRFAGLRDALSRYGLIAFLLVLPVVYGIRDLQQTGSLTRLGDNLIAGVSNGAIWALIAIGYTLVYGIIELINFAHGDNFMLGSFISVGLFGTLGLTLATGTLGLVGGLLACLVVAMVGVRRAQRHDRARRLPAAAQRAQAGAAASPRSGSPSSCRTSASCGSAARRSRSPT